MTDFFYDFGTLDPVTPGGFGGFNSGIDLNSPTLDPTLLGNYINNNAILPDAETVERINKRGPWSQDNLPYTPIDEMLRQEAFAVGKTVEDLNLEVIYYDVAEKYNDPIYDEPNSPQSAIKSFEQDYLGLDYKIAYVYDDPVTGQRMNQQLVGVIQIVLIRIIT